MVPSIPVPPVHPCQKSRLINHHRTTVNLYQTIYFLKVDDKHYPQTHSNANDNDKYTHKDKDKDTRSSKKNMSTRIGLNNYC